jgi:sarcosine oxidase subunit alpha
VVIRLADDTWLCHTTTGGRRPHPRPYGGLAPDRMARWQVYCANVTEQYAQIAVAGPRARECSRSSAAWTSRARRCPS